MSEKFAFYVILNGTATDDPERFQRSLTTCYVMGIEPIEYEQTTLLDENKNVVQDVILVKCQERWKKASKRFFRKAKFEFMNQKHKGLPVFG